MTGLSIADIEIGDEDFSVDCVKKFKSLKKAIEMNSPILLDLFDNSNLAGKYVIIYKRDTLESVFKHNGKYFIAFDYFFEENSKMDIKKAKTKMPQLFI